MRNQAEIGMTHSCELENFSGKIFEDSCNVDCSLGSNAHLVLGVVLQETLDTTAGELRKSSVSQSHAFHRAHKFKHRNLEVCSWTKICARIGRS